MGCREGQYVGREDGFTVDSVVGCFEVITVGWTDGSELGWELGAKLGWAVG